jgi:predicted metallo-beta-lactamase superfamily hydrolase
LLLISESRKRPITESLLYKQIIGFFQSEGIEGYFDIVFISIADGVIPAVSENETLNPKRYTLNPTRLPPKNFRSGRSWISKAVKEEMAENIEKYLKKNGNKYNTKIAYVRGSYLEAVRMANKAISGQRIAVSENETLNPKRYTLNPITELLAEEELSNLKKRGIRWMKIGLRMPEAFTIFQKRIRDIMKEEERKQLQLF